MNKKTWPLKLQIAFILVNMIGVMYMSIPSSIMNSSVFMSYIDFFGYVCMMGVLFMALPVSMIGLFYSLGKGHEITYEVPTLFLSFLNGAIGIVVLVYVIYVYMSV